MTTPCGEESMPVIEDQTLEMPKNTESSDNADMQKTSLQYDLGDKSPTDVTDKAGVSKTLSHSNSTERVSSKLSLSKSNSTENNVFSDIFKTMSRSSSVTDERWPHLIVTQRFKEYEQSLQKSRNPVIIERRNLVNISKLIVKELIETSQKHGRMLDSDHMPLQHFFIVLEHVLRHGLKPKKGLLGPKKELWDILQLVEKLNPEAADITASVRDLPTVKTHMGRARAWLRLALMQKKLADYLQVLVDHRDDILIEYFETDALLMSDEAIVILGKLLSLNVIDCNLCVKEEDLDCQQGVIDFSLYLRSACYHHDHPEEVTTQAEDNMSLVLDQKNYIEELNRHLNATVGNLQTQVESLTTTNALMREDLSIAEKNLRILIQENENLKNQLNSASSANHVHHEEKPDSLAGNGDANVKKALEDERKQRQDMERELHLQVGLKAEMEVAMKLLERDVHQKQDTIIELRRQLEDIKMINLEMYKKLQECEEDISEKTEMDSENSLKHKTELVSKLEAKVASASDRLHSLEQNYQSCQTEKSHILETLKKGHSQLSEESNKNNQLELEMKSEVSKRQTIEENYHRDREKLKQLTGEIAQLKAVNSSYLTLQEEHYKLQDKYRESELALEELGTQLSVSKLQVSDLMEEQHNAKRTSEGQWAKDKEAKTCRACDVEFTVTRRRHHCRNCGEIFCNLCSDNKMPLPSAAKPVRVCDECNVKLIEKQSVVTS